jgi:predicted DNA-binding transcriptional regulator YafY
MTRSGTSRRRPAVHITLTRAARLHRLVSILASGPRTRAALLSELGIGLRTFYRELELLKKCAVKVRLTAKDYVLKTTRAEAEGRLPFPDPQLSFAEMSELSKGPGAAARRLAALLDQVVGAPPAPVKKPRKRAVPPRH